MRGPAPSLMYTGDKHSCTVISTLEQFHPSVFSGLLELAMRQGQGLSCLCSLQACTLPLSTATFVLVEIKRVWTRNLVQT